MTTLDDKLLGFKSQNYVSSSESEGEEDDGNITEEDNRDDVIDIGGIAAPPDFRLEVPKVGLQIFDDLIKWYFLFPDVRDVFKKVISSILTAYQDVAKNISVTFL